MTDIPIIFSGPMVRALLEGRKSQTRLPLKARLEICASEHLEDLELRGFEAVEQPDGQYLIYRCPYAVGDRLWVREAFSGPHEYDVEKWPPGAWFTGDPIWYWSDGNPDDGDWTRPRPSIHMPRWASRLTLIVTDVRVQRLQEISEEDAKAEGFCAFGPDIAEPYQDGPTGDATDAFRHVWGDLHGPDAWAANPWVAAISFDCHRANIDALAPVATLDSAGAA